MATKRIELVSDEELQIINERIGIAYNDIHSWIKYIASEFVIPGHWTMDIDDIMQESWCVLCTIARIYKDKPYNQFKALAMVSIRNNMGAMRYANTLTHRKAELFALSLDYHYDDAADTLESLLSPGNVTCAFSDDNVGYMNPEYWLIQAERISRLSDKFNKLDWRVLDVLTGNNTKAFQQLRLMISRRNFVFENPTMFIDPLFVARVLCEPVKEIEKSFDRIKKILSSKEDDSCIEL